MFNLSNKPKESKESKNNYKRFNGVASPTRPSKRQAVGRSFLRFHRDEHGGTIFSLLIAVLGLAIMVGFTTNMASETIERQRVQHAADSLAYASGLWLARGMNAVSSMNHTMGEKTAYTAMINALAGPETEFSPIKEDTEMSNRLKHKGPIALSASALTYEITDPLNDMNMEKWSPKPLSFSGLPSLNPSTRTPQSSQRSVVQKLIKDFTDYYYTEMGSGKYKVGSAVFDAKLQLKQTALECLNNKAIASWMMDVEETPKLPEMEILHFAGITVHAGEDMILGIDPGFGPGFDLQSLNIPGIGSLEEAFNSCGQALDKLNNVTSLFDEFQNNLKSMGADLSSLGSELSSITSEIKDLQETIEDNLDELKNLNIDVSQLDKLLDSAKDGIDDISSSALSKLGDRIKNEPEAVGKIGDKLVEAVGAKLENVANQGKEYVSKPINQAKDAINKVNDQINKVTGQASEAVKDVFDRVNKLTSKIDEASQKINGLTNVIGQFGEQLSSSLAKIRIALNNGKQFASNPIGSLLSSLGAMNLTSSVITEYGELIDLETKLAENSHDKREELYGQMEKINDRFAFIVGSDKQEPEERYIYKKIYETSDQLKEAYATGDHKGFANATVAPLDTLVPNASEFNKMERKTEPVSYQDQSFREGIPSLNIGDELIHVMSIEEIMDRALKATSGSWLSAISESAKLVADILFSGNKESSYGLYSEWTKRYEKYQSWRSQNKTIDINAAGCNEECIKAARLYNQTLSNLDKEVSDLHAIYEWLTNAPRDNSFESVLKNMTIIVQTLFDVAWDIGLKYGKVGQLVKKTTTKLNYLTGMDMDPLVNETLAAIKDEFKKNAGGMYAEEGIKDFEKTIKTTNAGFLMAGSLLKSLRRIQKTLPAKKQFKKFKEVLDLVETLATTFETLADDIVKAKNYYYNSNYMSFVSNVNNNFRDYQNRWQKVWNTMQTLKVPTCNTPDDCNGNGQSAEADKNKKPLLPVLGETECVSDSGSNYLKNQKSEPWKKDSNSPYSNLPVPPSTGDSSRLKLHTAVEALAIAADAYIAAMIAEYTASFQYHKAAHAGRIQVALAQLQKVNLQYPSWTPGKHGHTNNPSVWNYPSKEFDYDSEKISQWVRATNPVAHTLRSGLCKYYEDKVPLSKLSTYINAWSYRYVLSESFFLRSHAQRPYSEGKANKMLKDKCCLYVIAGSNMENKGNESYWENSELLDKMFSVCAIVQSEPRKAAAGPKVFKRLGENDGITAAAQSTFYPYNGRNSLKNGALATYRTSDAPVEKKAQCQPYTCWDVLQWKNQNPGGLPVIYAPEWECARMGKGSFSYETMTEPSTLDTLEDSKIELSWEAMTTPVTKSRLERVEDDSKATEAIKRAAKNAAEHAPLLAN